MKRYGLKDYVAFTQIMKRTGLDFVAFAVYEEIWLRLCSIYTNYEEIWLRSGTVTFFYPRVIHFLFTGLRAAIIF